MQAGRWTVTKHAGPSAEHKAFIYFIVDYDETGCVFAYRLDKDRMKEVTTFTSPGNLHAVFKAVKYRDSFYITVR